MEGGYSHGGKENYTQSAVKHLSRENENLYCDKIDIGMIKNRQNLNTFTLISLGIFLID